MCRISGAALKATDSSNCSYHFKNVTKYCEALRIFLLVSFPFYFIFLIGSGA